MKVLFDTNVVLDSLLDRKPFSVTVSRLVARVERGELEGVLGATTVTTIHDIVSKALDRNAAVRALRDLLSLVSVAPVDGRTLALAVDLESSDYEDAILHEAARLAGATTIVTRNGGDFKNATLGIDSPEELEAALEAEEDGDGDLWRSRRPRGQNPALGRGQASGDYSTSRGLTGQWLMEM